MDTEPKDIKVSENLQLSTISVEISEPIYLNQVDEDGRVIPDPKIIADTNESVRPSEDEDAIYHFLPFNPQNACREVHDRLRPGKAMQLIMALSTELRLLPNPNQDTVGHLRMTFLTTRQELEQCQYGKYVTKHSRMSWAGLIAQRVKFSLFQKAQPSWADFVGRLELVIDEYSHAYSLWLFMRWLRRKITKIEQPSLLYQPSKKHSTKQLQPYKTFDQLFKNSVDEKRCVDILYITQIPA